MISVFFIFSSQSTIKDLRQHNILIKPSAKIKKKYFRYLSIDKPYEVLNLSLPLDSFFFFSSLTSVKILFSTVMLSTDIKIVFDKLRYYWFFLLLRFNLFNVYFLEDLSSNVSESGTSVVLPTSSYLTNSKIISHVFFNDNLLLPSLSLVFSSFN